MISFWFKKTFFQQIVVAFLVLVLLDGISWGANPQKKLLKKEFQFDGAEKITYKTVDEVILSLHVIKPDGHSSKDQRPAIIFFFGGGWFGGSPKQFIHHCEYFASRGMVAITAEYRVSSRHGTKAIQCVADAKSAVRWLRKNSDKLGIDPGRIVASGGSAGGHIAACSGVVTGMEESGEDLSISSQPNAMVLFNPCMALSPINGQDPLGKNVAKLVKRVGGNIKSISPYHHIKKDQPPTIIFFGTDDRLLFGAEQFTKVSKKAGNRCELMTWDGLRHGFFNYRKNNNKPYIETVRAADKFLLSLGYLKGEPTINLPK